MLLCLLLVQAVSQLRQKRLQEVVVSLNNLLSCVRASPEAGPMAWGEREELLDLYGLYAAKQMDEAKRAQLQVSSQSLSS